MRLNKISLVYALGITLVSPMQNGSDALQDVTETQTQEALELEPHPHPHPFPEQVCLKLLAPSGNIVHSGQYPSDFTIQELSEIIADEQKTKPKRVHIIHGINPLGGQIRLDQVLSEGSDSIILNLMIDRPAFKDLIDNFIRFLNDHPRYEAVERSALIDDSHKDHRIIAIRKVNPHKPEIIKIMISKKVQDDKIPDLLEIFHEDILGKVGTHTPDEYKRMMSEFMETKQKKQEWDEYQLTDYQDYGQQISVSCNNLRIKRDGEYIFTLIQTSHIIDDTYGLIYHVAKASRDIARIL